MPDQELKCTVNFDRDEIRAKLERFTFNEARRYRGPIYEALIKELYEEGCRTTAKHFECLANKEATLVKSKTIRVHIYSELELLIALFENAKHAEKAYHMKKCGGLVVTFRLLYQCLLILEPYSVIFNWLLRDVFVIISKLCDSIKEPNDSTAEMIAKIYYKHGVYLSAKASDLPRAIKYLEKALALTRCNMWYVQDQRSGGSFETLHEAESKQLCDVLLKHAAEVAHSDSVKAAELAQKAILAIAEVGIDANKVDFYRATIARASYLIASEDRDVAIRLLEQIYDDINVHWYREYKKLHCKCAMFMAMCYSAFNLDEEAIQKFSEAVKLSRRFEWEILEAEILINMGKHLSKSTGRYRLAKEAFEIARKIYTKSGDMNAVGQTSYLLCKLKAQEIMPHLMALLKSSQEQFCDYSNLRLWKMQVKPFWPTMQEDSEKQELDEIYCLLTAKSQVYTVGIKNPPQPLIRERRRSSKGVRASKTT